MKPSTAPAGAKVDGWIVVEPPCWGAGDLSVLNELVPDPPERRREALGLPDELQESLGIELWRGLANVRLWADTTPSGRGGLFSRIDQRGLRSRRAAARVHAPELTAALETFGELTANPQLARARDLVDACKLVAAWAEDHGLYETAIQFAEAAAAVSPARPSLANLAARLCRIGGQQGRAELWYDRAIGLTRQALKVAPKERRKLLRREYIYAHLGFANLLLERDEPIRAIKTIRRAALTAKAAGMKGPAAEALHDAMYVATMNERLAQAAVYARRAASVYPYHHPRYPALAHDVAVLMILHGMYGAALSILQSAVRKITSPADNLVAWGSVARAAAGAGRLQRFRDAVRKVEELAPTYPQAGATALYSIAEGARLLGYWDAAERFAAAAAAGARETSSAQILTRAEHLMNLVAARTPGDPELPKSDPRGVLLRRLAPALRLRVYRWRGPTWRPRHAGLEDNSESVT